MSNLSFQINGQSATEEQALNAYVAYETANSGISTREAIKIFNRAVEDTEDGAEARDELLSAGVEVFL